MIRAKKSLGQNFLIDKNILKKIVSIIEIKDKSILEIGPGTGNLTSYILKDCPKKFFVVEKDKKLAIFLKKKFEDKIIIINDDILNINEKKLYKDRFIVFGNLPYNISTEILAKWILNLDDKNFWFDTLILMFQKEVADRIISKFNSSKYGRLSILTNWKLNVDKICDIKSSSFFPKPKVDSSLLIFKPKKNFHQFKNPKNLEKITRVFFNQRRKKLKTPFNVLFKDNIELQNSLNIDLNLRPHNLSQEIYYKLTEEYEKL
ncbi:16S rRNA (adenine(1518)-N(6)/adenine(1519)-N(6))-dimethyltransferase RsmA [Candidatus Pelagibacter sp.]|uniref:16S rRNA (adenine(1518)-N(6)/adenine(1519)-N(6))- dimethyltransferase RsmA n=1 Tax=Candidatus Pelagibacter sp. TaxID=2024849 RepID=UPI003F84B9FC